MVQPVDLRVLRYILIGLRGGFSGLVVCLLLISGVCWNLCVWALGGWLTLFVGVKVGCSGFEFAG